MSLHIEEWLDQYLDGELSPMRQAKVKAHLEQCPHCQELLAERRLLSALLQKAPAAAGLKSADQFVAEVGLQLRGKPAAPKKHAAPNSWHWSWALVPLALMLAWVFLQTVSVLSDILVAIPGAEQISQQSVQSLPGFTTLSQLTGNELVAQGADLLAFLAPSDLGGLTNLAVLVIIGLIYASWLAGWWVRSQNLEA